MKTYLLEVGTENLPVDLLNTAENQFKEILSKKLSEEKLTYEDIKIYYTPRRLAVVIQGLLDKQEDESKSIKGPPAHAAFKDGKPTPAANGFAKKSNIDVSKLEIQDFSGIKYVVANVELKGKSCGEILQNIIPECILGLKGSHFMRWEDLEIKFSRPIRWLTSLLDNEHLEINIADIKSSKDSYGHRFLNPNKCKINSPTEYEKSLEQGFVIVDLEKRKEKIKTLINEAAKKIDGYVPTNENLLLTVANLVEWPYAAVGSFDEEYLQLPDDVTKTVMAAHQKYFPVYDNATKKLKNNFICIINNDGSHSNEIIKGNQRVLKARLEDAMFFHKEDSKQGMYSRVELLKGITFQKGLGNMFQKMERIKGIATELSRQLKLSTEEENNILRASELCKADLSTFMVREFTELEGIIGGIYSLNQHENSEVATGVREHYLPRSVEDNLPSNIIGKSVSLADKIDTIVSVFSIGKVPTGSADPLGLRRAALGILSIILNSNLNVNISKLIAKGISLLDNPKINEEELNQKISEFIIQRYRILLIEKGFRYDVVEAVLSAKDPLCEIEDVIKRLEALNKFVALESYTPLHESANRIIRILKSTDSTNGIDNTLLKHQAEIELNKAVNSISFENKNYDKLLNDLEKLTPYVQKFFDDVMVMDKDEQIKNNRLALLTKVNDTYRLLADFSKIVN